MVFSLSPGAHQVEGREREHLGRIHEVPDRARFVRLMRELELARAVGHAVRHAGNPGVAEHLRDIDRGGACACEYVAQHATAVERPDAAEKPYGHGRWKCMVRGSVAVGGVLPAGQPNSIYTARMKIPKGLQPLIDDGMVDTVVRRLKSGKEASVYIVACGGEVRCAKVYKEAEQRGFHKLAQYQEGRKTRSSRDARAMGRRGRHGRRVQEEEWKNAEVDALFRLAGAGVRVPAPYLVHEGVLLMELVRDAGGDPAPRLNDVEITATGGARFDG